MGNVLIKRTGDKKEVELKEKNGVYYLVFPRIEELGIVEHLFSTRLGGVSKGCYSEMNLSYTRGDVKEAVDENYMRISDVLGHGHKLDDFVSTFQTHTTNIRVVTEGLSSSNTDLMLVSTFENFDALKGYSKNPLHVEVANSKVRPFTASRNCFDYEV